MALTGPYPFYGKTRYHYRTLDGGPPNNGAPPSALQSAPGLFPGQGFPPFGMFPGIPRYPVAPNPSFMVPPNSYGLSDPYNPGMPCFATNPIRPSTYGGVLVRTGGTPFFEASPSPPLEIGGRTRTAIVTNTTNQAQDQPAPANRVDGQLIKVADGTGYLAAEENSKFHVLCPGYDFRNMGSKFFPQENLHFKVQSIDSTATVQSLIRRLGGLDPPRLPTHLPTSYVGIEEWHELGNGKFVQGSCIKYLDEMAQMTVKDVGWGPHRGQAGLAKPVWVMLHP